MVIGGWWLVVGGWWVVIGLQSVKNIIITEIDSENIWYNVLRKELLEEHVNVYFARY